MARPVVGDKRADIRSAAVAEVVRCGYSGASVNRIAKRANLAVGTIYRHFDSKEHLLRAVYLEVKSELHRAVMDAASEHRDSAARIKAAWFAMLEYAREHPDDFLFSETVGAQNILTESEARALDVMVREIRELLEAGVADGTLRDSPITAHLLVLTAPAIRLARTAASERAPLDYALAEDVFSMLWEAVASS